VFTSFPLLDGETSILTVFEDIEKEEIDVAETGFVLKIKKLANNAASKK
jgi:hypothetical protein